MFEVPLTQYTLSSMNIKSETTWRKKCCTLEHTLALLEHINLFDEQLFSEITFFVGIETFFIMHVRIRSVMLNVKSEMPATEAESKILKYIISCARKGEGKKTKLQLGFKAGNLFFYLAFDDKVLKGECR